MKRFWMLALVLAAASMSLAMRASAQSASEVKDSLDQYKDDVNSGMATLSSRIGDLESAGKLKWKGDFRFRYEYFTQAQDNSPLAKNFSTPWPANVNIPNRPRPRIRLRFGAEKQVSSEVFAAFRIATGAISGTTGNPSDPTSTNQTLGGEDTDKALLLDTAYFMYTPKYLGGKVDVYAGKMLNILDSTAITWDGDTNPEGAAVAVRLPEQFGAKAHYMYIGNESAAKLEQYLYNVQLSKDLMLMDQDIHVMAGYEDVPWVTSMEGTVPASFTRVSALNGPFSVTGNGMVAPGSLIKGQAPSQLGWIPDIRMVEGMVKIKNKIGGQAFTWTFHAARNTNSFNLNKFTNANIHGLASISNANAFFAKVETKVDKLGLGLQWGYIEPNAVLSLYSDSDSGAGYNDNKWLKADVSYDLADGLTVSLGQYAVKRVVPDLFGGTPTNAAGGTSRQPLFRSQLDFVVKI